MSDPLILLVEDAPADVLLTKRALKKSQIKAELLVASDGVDAWQMLMNQPDVSLVLLDLHLPKMNGLHLLEQVRQDEHTREMCVVVVTSSEMDSDRSRALEIGADGYIAKPIDPTKLTKVIQELDIESLKPSSGNVDG